MVRKCMSLLQDNKTVSHGLFGILTNNIQLCKETKEMQFLMRQKAVRKSLKERWPYRLKRRVIKRLGGERVPPRPPDEIGARRNT